MKECNAHARENSKVWCAWDVWVRSKFLCLSYAKLRDGIFLGSDTQKLLRDNLFEIKMILHETDTWIACPDFKSTVK